MVNNISGSIPSSSGVSSRSLHNGYKGAVILSLVGLIGIAVTGILVSTTNCSATTFKAMLYGSVGVASVSFAASLVLHSAYEGKRKQENSHRFADADVSFLNDRPGKKVNK